MSSVSRIGITGTSSMNRFEVFDVSVWAPKIQQIPYTEHVYSVGIFYYLFK